MNADIDQFLAAFDALFADYRRLAETLSDEELATRSLCPDWTVREVIAHTIAVEVVLDGWTPSVDTPPPFEKLGPAMTETASMDRNAFAAWVTATTESRLADLRGLDPAVLDQPSITPAGVGTYGRFLQVRLFDLWVHARDIAIPLGTTLDDAGFAAQAALQEVDDSVGYIVGKKIQLPEGRSIVFHVTGGVPRDIAVDVDGRATRVAAVAAPDVEVTADVTTFVMLAAGRIDPQAQIDAGAITWSGDAEWGERAARNLAYTR